ncbi:hypothetical protein [Sutcliffiella rhizosphaerae]|uniref:Lipoprotein n=1 Tax=Sutcliffiella rhizosphaerae TaxID=2880967 RepID=A0ABM8YQ52_9BACI|nr:hypothetical protein [Sutcliffiella rhizosphaerae]CAG9622131.1 hypothetical protein BACCIP111883_02922 [Sutcliffiella rhizosphaerae]
MFLGRAIISFIFVSLFLLTGCSVSLEDASENAKGTFDEVLKSEKKEVNAEASTFHYYLPPQFEVDTEDDNNIIFAYKDEPYILFVNLFEEQDSKVLYDSIKSSYPQTHLDHTLLEDGRLGYLLIAPVSGEEEGMHEVTVGIGGVRMTTVTETSNIENSTKNMMEIVSSVTIK